MKKSKNIVNVVDFLKEMHMNEALHDEKFVNELSLALAKYCHLLLDIRVYNDINLRNQIMELNDIKDIRRYEPFISTFMKLNHIRRTTFKSAFLPGWSMTYRNYNKDLNAVYSLINIKIKDSFMNDYSFMNYFMSIIFGASKDNIYPVIMTISNISRKIKMAIYGLNYFKTRDITTDIKPNYKVQAYFNAIKFYLQNMINLTNNNNINANIKRSQFIKNINSTSVINEGTDARKVLKLIKRIIDKYYKYRSIDDNGIFKNKYDSELFDGIKNEEKSTFFNCTLDINSHIEKILFDSKYHIELNNDFVTIDRVSHLFENIDIKPIQYEKPDILTLKKRKAVRNDTFEILPGKMSKKYYTAYKVAHSRKRDAKYKNHEKLKKYNNNHTTSNKKLSNHKSKLITLNICNKYIKLNQINSNSTYRVRISDPKRKIKSILSVIEIEKKDANTAIIKTNKIELTHSLIKAIKEFVFCNKKKFDKTFSIRFNNKPIKYEIKRK